MYGLIVSMNFVHDFPIETRDVKKFGNLEGPTATGGEGFRISFETQQFCLNHYSKGEGGQQWPVGWIVGTRESQEGTNDEVSHNNMKKKKKKEKEGK